MHGTLKLLFLLRGKGSMTIFLFFTQPFAQKLDLLHSHFLLRQQKGEKKEKKKNLNMDMFRLHLVKKVKMKK